MRGSIAETASEIWVGGGQVGLKKCMTRLPIHFCSTAVSIYIIHLMLIYHSRSKGRIYRIWKSSTLRLPPLHRSLSRVPPPMESQGVRLMSASKRKIPLDESKSPAKKIPKSSIPEYHEIATIKNEDGSVQWPAPQSQINQARDIILRSARSSGNILIVPDKDADGQVLDEDGLLRCSLMTSSGFQIVRRCHLASHLDAVGSA